MDINIDKKINFESEFIMNGWMDQWVDGSMKELINQLTNQLFNQSVIYIYISEMVYLHENK